MTGSQRKAMLRNLTNQLLAHDSIKTTLPRAKELRSFVEPLITISKTDTLANRRLVFNRLRNRVVVGRLFDSIRQRCQHRPGGYLRILKLDSRNGDAADMAIVELVD